MDKAAWQKRIEQVRAIHDGSWEMLPPPPRWRVFAWRRWRRARSHIPNLIHVARP